MAISNETWDKIYPIARKIGVLEIAIKYNRFETYGLKSRFQTYQRIADLRAEIQELYSSDLFKGTVTIKKK